MMYTGSDWGSWVASSVWMLFHLAFLTTGIAAVFWILLQLSRRNEQNLPEK